LPTDKTIWLNRRHAADTYAEAKQQIEDNFIGARQNIPTNSEKSFCAQNEATTGQ